MPLSGPILDQAAGTASPLAPVSLNLLADIDCIVWRREMAADGVIRYSWFSNNVASILGVPPEALAVNSKGALTVIHWADRDAHIAALHQSARMLQPCQENFRAITADGETRWLRGSSYPRKTGDGRIVWEGLWQDHTQRIRAEAQHQMLMDRAADCIFIISGNARVTWSNAAAERNFGYPAEELLNRCIGELIDLPGCSSCTKKHLVQSDNAADCLPHGSHEVSAMRQDGTTFPFEITISETRSDGKLSLIVIGRDITRRRTAERLLEESEQRLRVTFAAASLGIVVVDLDGTIRFYNPAFETMSDSSRGSLLGVSLYSFVPDTIMPPPSRIPPPGMAFCVMCEPHLEDGGDHHWRLTGTKFAATPNAAEHSMLFFIEDTTETTHIAQERRQLELMLQEGHKLEALGRLAGGIAHELNNMLGPILMGAEMIARTAPLDHRNTERVQRIIDAAKNSRDIVRNVLAYCRKEQKTLTPVDIVPIFDGFSAMAASILPPSIKVEKYREVEHAIVVADAGQLQQVLLNLVNNARDAMFGAGTLKLELVTLQPRQLAALSRKFVDDTDGTGSRPNPLSAIDFDRPHVEIRVSDTGCGISPSTATKIFDPFFTTKPVGQGTGLGLSVVQGIIKSMSGVIIVDSTLGKGTSFLVILPQSNELPV
ncbi:MAG: PAS domain S-box protein [Phaeospirillum sp.]|nr:PAS domain S-box protein [Phaeospirillum sp.]